jgi:hypothetical protein
MTPPAVDDRRRGGPPAWLAVLAIGGLGLGLVLIVAQALGLGSAGAPPPSIAPAGAAAQQTRDLVAAALEGASIVVQDPQVAYRPGESPELVDVPRLVIQAVLPSDPAGGRIVIYELPSNGDADRVGRDFAAYLASGPGAIQYPRDTQFVLRRAGRTLVFYPWSPSVATDPRAADVATTLAGVGVPLGAP